MSEVTERGEVVSAGGVVVRPGAAGFEVVLAEQRDRNSEGLGIRLPKGHLEPGESAEQAALREVAEEVGIEARIVAPIDDVTYSFWDRRARRRIRKRVHFFLMSHVSGAGHAADGEMERVYWCALETAAKQLSFATERHVVVAAAALLDSDDPPSL